MTTKAGLISRLSHAELCLREAQHRIGNALATVGAAQEHLAVDAPEAALPDLMRAADLVERLLPLTVGESALVVAAREDAAAFVASVRWLERMTPWRVPGGGDG